MSTDNNPPTGTAAPDKRALLARMLREKAARPASSYPLSHGQRAMWTLHRLDPNNPAANEAMVSRIRGPLDLQLLRTVFRELQQRHPVLRTTYALQDGEPRAVVHETSSAEMEVIDAGSWDAGELQDRLCAAANGAFDLETGPVVRVVVFRRGEAESIILMSLHHIAVDMWSLVLLLEDLQVLSVAQRAGLRAGLPPPAHEYPEFVAWQAEMLQGPEGEEHWDFWRQQLSGSLPVLRLPADRPRPPLKTRNGGTAPFRLGEDLVRSLKALASARQTTLYAVLLAGCHALLHRLTGQDDVIVGSAASGRSQPRFEKIVGFFTNALPIRARPSADMTFAALLSQVRQTLLGAMEHQDFPMTLMLERIQPPRDPAHSPFFDVVCILQRPQRFTAERKDLGEGDGSFGTAGGDQGARLEMMGYSAELFGLERHAANFDLELEMLETATAVTGWVRFNRDLFDKATVGRMMRQFQTLLEGAAADPELSLAELPLLSEADGEEIRAAGEPARAVVAEDVVTLVERRAKELPEAVAVEAADERLTRAELNRRADRVARRLMERGVRRGDRVAVCLGRTARRVIALLGVLKARAAVVPLDPSDPPVWLQELLEQAEPALVLTEEALRSRLGSPAAPVLCLDGDVIGEIDQPFPAPTADPDGAAWLDVSSGRSIPITVEQLARRVAWLQDEFRLSHADGVLHHAPLSRSTTVAEVLWPLAHGARLVVAEPGSDKSSLARLLADHQVSVAHLLPSALGTFLKARQQAPVELPALRQVLCGGEVLRRDVVATFFRAFPRSRLSYLYAPPEAGGEAAAHDCHPDEAWEMVPAGRPTTRPLRILGERGELLAFGVEGDVALEVGGSLVRTGDRGFLAADGTLHLAADAWHVWNDGARVPLPLVEETLLQDPAVQACAVRARGSGTELVAYVVPAGPFAPERMQGRLAARLPAAMVPSAWVALASLPLTEGGAVDEEALARLEVFDAELIRRWEADLSAMPGVHQAAVLVEERREPVPPLHLADLLPPARPRPGARGALAP